MDQEDDQFFDDVEFPSSSVVVEAGEVEVVADEVQDDAEAVEGVIEPDVNRGREVLEQLPTAWTTPEWTTRPPQRRVVKRRARSATALKSKSNAKRIGKSGKARRQ